MTIQEFMTKRKLVVGQGSSIGGDVGIVVDKSPTTYTLSVYTSNGSHYLVISGNDSEYIVQMMKFTSPKNEKFTTAINGILEDFEVPVYLELVLYHGHKYLTLRHKKRQDWTFNTMYTFCTTQYRNLMTSSLVDPTEWQRRKLKGYKKEKNTTLEGQYDPDSNISMTDIEAAI